MLSTDQKQMLEADITMKELELALKATKNRSLPGTTGFTYPFYKVFWSRLKYIIYNMVKQSYQEKKLPVYLSKGLITLIPKGKKDS